MRKAVRKAVVRGSWLVVREPTARVGQTATGALGIRDTSALGDYGNLCARSVLRPCRLTVRTSVFQAGSRGSTPLRAATLSPRLARRQSQHRKSAPPPLPDAAHFDGAALRPAGGVSGARCPNEQGFASGFSAIFRAVSLPARVLFLDNSIYPRVYRPFDHWRRWFPTDAALVRIALGEELPSLDGFTHLLVSGSEASIVAPDPWVGQQIELIREASRRGVPVLGSCHGHQMLALAFGGRVARAREPELGWIALEIDGSDPMFESAEQPVLVFVSHFDEVASLPEEFVVPARSRRCAIHAFRHRSLPVWGLQSHPEIDIPEGEALLADFAALDPRVAAAPWHRPPRDSGLVRSIVANFLALGR
jgi:GMP synthase-like glutamine amidotransferase